MYIFINLFIKIKIRLFSFWVSIFILGVLMFSFDRCSKALFEGHPFRRCDLRGDADVLFLVLAAR